MLLETAAPAVPQEAAATGPCGFRAGAAINYKKQKGECLSVASDKGEHCLTGGAGHLYVMGTQTLGKIHDI